MASSERGIYSAPAVVGLTAVAPELRFSAYASNFGAIAS